MLRIIIARLLSFRNRLPLIVLQATHVVVCEACELQPGGVVVFYNASTIHHRLVDVVLATLCEDAAFENL